MTEAARRLPEVAAWGLAIAVLFALSFLPDVLTKLRASGQPHAAAPRTCDPRTSECEARFPDGVTVRLTARPGVRASEPVAYEVQVRGGVAARSLVVQGAEMNMGVWTTALTAGAPGTWTASAVLPYCTLERMEWSVVVQLDGRTAGFTLVTSP